MPRFNEHSALLFTRAIEAGITSPRELANLMGNSSVETGQFGRMHENLNYRSTNAIIAAVSSADDRFTRAQIDEAVASRDPRRIATILYENRADLGNTEPGDGYRYHGRGYLQFTGRENYTRYGERFGMDLANNPDQAADPETSARLAIAYWRDRVPENLRTDARRAGAIINGGDNGADERVAAAAQWGRTITPELVAQVQRGELSMEDLVARGQQRAQTGATEGAGPRTEGAGPRTEGAESLADGSRAPVPGASVADQNHPGNPLFQRVTALTEQVRPPLTDEQRAYVAMTAASQGMTAENLAAVATRTNANGALEVAFGSGVQGQRSEGWTQLPQTMPPVERTSEYLREEMQSRALAANQPQVADAQRMSGP